MDGLEQSGGSVVVLQGEESGRALFERGSGCGQVLHVHLGVFAKAHEDGDIVREPLDLSTPAGLLHVVGKLDTPIALEGSPMGGDGLVFEVNGQGFMIGLDCNRFSNKPRGNGIGIAIKGDGKIRVYLGRCGIPTVGEQIRKGRQGFRLEPVDGALPRGGVHSEVCDLIAPLCGLGLNIVQVTKRSQGPEVVADVVDGAFLDLSLLVGLPDVAGDRHHVKRPQKIQEGLVEPHQGAVALDDGCEHVVVDQLLRASSEELEGAHQCPMQGFLPLGVGKLQGKESAMAFDDRKGIELSGSAPVGE